MSNKWISASNRTAIEERDNMTCCYCGKACEKYNDRTNNYDYATLDHIVARSEIKMTCATPEEYKLAIQDIVNLVLVCNGCNTSKQNIPLFVWCAKKSYNYGVILAEIARRINSK